MGRLSTQGCDLGSAPHAPCLNFTPAQAGAQLRTGGWVVASSHMQPACTHMHRWVVVRKTSRNWTCESQHSCRAQVSCCLLVCKPTRCRVQPLHPPGFPPRPAPAPHNVGVPRQQPVVEHLPLHVLVDLQHSQTLFGVQLMLQLSRCQLPCGTGQAHRCSSRHPFQRSAASQHRQHGRRISTAIQQCTHSSAIATHRCPSLNQLDRDLLAACPVLHEHCGAVGTMTQLADLSEPREGGMQRSGQAARRVSGGSGASGGRRQGAFRASDPGPAAGPISSRHIRMCDRRHHAASRHTRTATRVDSALVQRALDCKRALPHPLILRAAIDALRRPLSLRLRHRARALSWLARAWINGDFNKMCVRRKTR